MNKKLFILLSVLLIAIIVIPLGFARASVDDSYTTALLHFEGANHSTTYTDEAGNTWSNSSAEISTSQHKFGSSALKVNAYNQNIYSNVGAAAQFGTGDFTVDAWIYATDLLHLVSADANHWFDIEIGTSHVAFWMSSNCTTWNMMNGTESTHTISQNAWHHIALVRYGTSIKLYVDGVQEIATTSSASICNPTSNIYIGNGYGYIDELRISKGIARWTAAFTPPSAIYEPTLTGTTTPTDTYTPSYTPSITNTPTQTFTPSSTFTSTPTRTPTHTFTPSHTPTLTNTITPNGFFKTATPSATSTASVTETPGASSTPTLTPTITNTPQAVIWAPGTIDVGTDIQTAIGNLLFASPPSGWATNVYAVMDANSNGDGWSVSIVNLQDVEAPYTDWNLELNGAWVGSVDCIEIESTWSCEYYNPPAVDISGGQYGLMFPFRPGSQGIYGPGSNDTCKGSVGIGGGIHCGTTVLPGSLAVDFVGGDNYGTNIMPAYVYTAESGTVSQVCRDGTQVAVFIEGIYKLAYYHLAPSVSWKKGDTVTQSENLGSLIYGEHVSGCGQTHQISTVYHLHFVFQRPASGILYIGGCYLTIGTGYFTCDGKNIGVGGRLINTGETILVATPVATNANTIPPYTASGGSSGHIWDGLVYGFVNLLQSIGSSILPAHTPIGLVDYTDRLYETIYPFLQLISASQVIYITPTLVIGGIIAMLETIRFIMVAYRWIVRLVPMP